MCFVEESRSSENMFPGLFKCVIYKKLLKELENVKMIELSKTQANYLKTDYIDYSAD